MRRVGNYTCERSIDLLSITFETFDCYLLVGRTEATKTCSERCAEFSTTIGQYRSLYFCVILMISSKDFYTSGAF